VTRVAIVGGGLGGLAAAAFLHQAGVPAVVYEQARELREVGAGIMVPPNAARMLRRLGVLDIFSERAVQLDIGWEFRRWRDGTVLSAQDLTAKSARLYGAHTYTVHRADLLEAVKSALPADAVKLGKRLDGFSASATGVSLSFADGERAKADVLIGADGIHSVIRATLTEPPPPARTTTTCRTAQSSGTGTRRSAPPTRWRPTRGCMPTTLQRELIRRQVLIDAETGRRRCEVPWTANVEAPTGRETSRYFGVTRRG
jgi:2-polyprenyl-6-methoxyphenol hydroxylase-like FAD-dependent oxidoreductase